MNRLQGKLALVTGGGSGLGAAICRRFAEEGATVIVNDLRAGPAEVIAKEIDGHTSIFDVADSKAVAAAFADVAKRFGRLDILVNNAGIAKGGPFLKTEDETWREIFEVNLFSVAACTRLALPGMIEAGWGRVVNVASIAGLRGSPYTTAYTASKHALVGMTRSLALETAKKGVTVNAVCPGYVDTPMTDRTVANVQEKTGRSAEEARADIEKLGQQGRLLEADEVGAAIAFLCLPDSGGINGASLPLGGEG